MEEEWLEEREDEEQAPAALAGMCLYVIISAQWCAVSFLLCLPEWQSSYLCNHDNSTQIQLSAQ